MSRGSGGGSGGGRRGRGVVLVLLVVGALLLVGSLTRDTQSGEPYDPESTAPVGTKALVELLERRGAVVEVADELSDDVDVALAFTDVVPNDRHDDVRRWVADGGTFVIGDPRSELAPLAEPAALGPGAALTADGTIEQGDCEVDALDAVRTIDTGEGFVYATYIVDGSVAVCFAADDAAFVAVQSTGRGHVVGLASPAIFQNRSIGEADNAAMAVALLAPGPGTRVGLLTEDSFTGAEGRRGEVGDLLTVLTPSLRWALLELAVAAALVAAASARRLGRPLVESQPVQIASSELVGAVGDLLARQRDPERAAAVLRADLRRTLASRTGLPPDAPPAAVAAAVAARTGRTVDEVGVLLAGPPVDGDDELVRLTEQIDTLREEVLHGRTP